MSKRQVLFLCTGNSCRSQMAEALTNHFLGDGWQAYSAGTEPAGYVHPLAVQAMSEIDIDISGHRSKSTAEFRDVMLDLVVTVCGDAAEKCPAWLGSGSIIHLGFPDPAKAQGSQQERLLVFKQIREKIRRDVLNTLTEKFPPES